MTKLTHTFLLLKTNISFVIEFHPFQSTVPICLEILLVLDVWYNPEGSHT